MSYQPMTPEEIARHWGGEDNHLTKIDDGHWIFRGDEGFSRYKITVPGAELHLAEDDGRPFTVINEYGGYVVRCLTDAPDCWFVVPVKERSAS